MDKNSITTLFKGRFITGLDALQQKLAGIKAYVFDWDGVFNDGFKNEQGSSPFSEIDSMGTNLLRFSHYLRTRNNPVFAIISGEKNEAAFTLARRESFHAVYYKIKHKAVALEHLARTQGVRTDEIAFVFDDVLDLSAAKLAGLRIMVANSSTSRLVEFAVQKELVDYITAVNGQQHAVREYAELVMSLGNNYDETVQHRMDFSPVYQEYLSGRNAVNTSFFTTDLNNIVQAVSL